MIARFLERRFVGISQDPADPEVRKRYGLLEGWVSVLVNLLVFVIKLIPGLLIGSVGLVADAVHSLGDLATSGVVIWSFHAAAKPPDREHPFGHGRAESVASLIVAVLLLVGSVELARAAVQSLVHPRPVTASVLLLAVLCLTLVLKEWLARLSSRLGARIGSGALEADAWHHRSDALATLVVILALAGERMGWHRLDGLAGLVVAVVIAGTGIGLIRRSLDPLIGEAPTRELRRRIRQLAAEVPEVDAVHDVMVHSYGTLLVISLHVEVPVELDVIRAHDVAEQVERLLAERLRAVVVVHVDPVDRHHPLYGPLEGLLSGLVGEIPGAVEFHDLRLVGGHTGCNVVFDLAVEGADPAQVSARLRREILERFPEINAVVIEVEPALVYPLGL